MHLNFEKQPQPSERLPINMQPQNRFDAPVAQPIFWKTATGQIEEIWEFVNQVDLNQESHTLTTPTMSLLAPHVTVVRSKNDGEGVISITSPSLWRPVRIEHELKVEFERTDEGDLSEIYCVQKKYSTLHGRLVARSHLSSDSLGRLNGGLNPASVLIGLQRAVMARGALAKPKAHQTEL